MRFAFSAAKSEGVETLERRRLRAESTTSPSRTIQKTKNTLEDAGDDDNEEEDPVEAKTASSLYVGRLYTRTSRNSTSRTRRRWRRKFTETNKPGTSHVGPRTRFVDDERGYGVLVELLGRKTREEERNIPVAG